MCSAQLGRRAPDGILSTEPSVKGMPAPSRCPSPQRRDCVDGVTFRYPSRRQQGVTRRQLRVQPGERWLWSARRALANRQCSSCAALLRSAGRRILFDGVDIATVDPRELRRTSRLVAQDPGLFGTISENIRYAARSERAETAGQRGGGADELSSVCRKL